MESYNDYNKKDHCSLSNIDVFVCQHIHVDWEIDFKKTIFRGSARHSIKVIKEGCNVLEMDSSDIQIKSVQVNNKKADFSIGDTIPGLGQKVSVTLPEDLCVFDNIFDVYFEYSTGETASAIQWLDREATKGGKYPYVFTQCQAIHARSLLPCQDSPGIKTTYTAKVSAPEWCTVLMSAISEKVESVNSNTKVHHWRQNVPVPTYLIALAAGNLVSSDISPRVRIWSEPEVISAAASEFSETEDFLCVAESLTCPYEWGRYDVLCLPPSFPYGGMENPCLTFATPTLLAGDKSLADVIAHEIAHSWTGNLVTSHTWEHFWLNEGWTVWLERKITSKIKKNHDILKLAAYGGYKHLVDDIKNMGEDNIFTQLVWPLTGQDPDEAFSSVPYEKGFNTLHYLEGKVGTPLFEAFAKAYLQKFKCGTVTSGEFKDCFIDYIQEKGTPAAINAIKAIDWTALYHTRGIPKDPHDFSNKLMDQVKDLADRWIHNFKSNDTSSNFSSKDLAEWSSLQKIIFLDILSDYSENKSNRLFSSSFLETMDACYSFTAYNNGEIKFRWHILCLRCGVDRIIPDAVSFVTSQGRMKFVRPLYRALNASVAGKAHAKSTFEKFKNMYHPIAKKMIEQDFEKASKESTTSSSSVIQGTDAKFFAVLTGAVALGAIIWYAVFRPKK